MQRALDVWRQTDQRETRGKQIRIVLYNERFCVRFDVKINFDVESLYFNENCFKKHKSLDIFYNFDMTYVINFTTDFENLTTQKVISTKLLTLSNNNYFFFQF